MRYVFFGTPSFAALVLKEIISAGLPPIALVCNPNRPVGRKKVITPPLTKIIAENYNLSSKLYNLNPIQILQPEKLDAAFLDKLRSLNADFYVVAAYAKIFKKDFLTTPRLGVIGVHPSLLPKYRGASPIQSAILSGDEETGVNIFMLTPGIDNGDIIAGQGVKIKDKNYLELEKELAEIGGKLLVKVLPDFVAGRIKPEPQDHSKATLTKKFTSEDGFVSHEDLQMAEEIGGAKAAEIERKIRALGEEPGVYTMISWKPSSAEALKGKRVKILKASLVDGKLKIEQIQKEGGKPSNFY